WIQERIRQGCTDDFSYENFENKEGLEDTVAVDTLETFRTVRRTSPSSAMVACSRLGSFLKAEFTSLEDSGDGIPGRRHQLWTPPSHAMACELQLRRDGGNRYRLHFYEPNKTLVHRTIEAGSLEEIGRWHLDQLMSPDYRFQLMGPASDPVFLATRW